MNKSTDRSDASERPQEENHQAQSESTDPRVVATRLGVVPAIGVSGEVTPAVDRAGPAIPPTESFHEGQPGNLVIGSIPALRLFCSYSHKDENLRDQLAIHLKLLQRKGLIASWHDRLIRAGQEWNEQISENLEQADLILLLVSAYFIASDYCYNVEMIRALERHEEGTARVIPVIVRDVDWSDAPFSNLQYLPKNGKAVRRWLDRDAAWRNVAEGIKAVVMEIRESRLHAIPASEGSNPL
jgi:hypothetical protein